MYLGPRGAVFEWFTVVRLWLGFGAVGLGYEKNGKLLLFLEKKTHFGTYRRGRFRGLLKGGDREPPFLCQSHLLTTSLAEGLHQSVNSNIYSKVYIK